MQKLQYRSIWISDAHLCSRDCRTEYLLSFLRCTKSEYLYIVGDFIDVWQFKRRWYWPQIFNNVIQKVLSKAKKGTKVVYIPGNHDEVLRDFAGAHFGDVCILREAVHETADGKRLLVLHGDQFDSIVQHSRWLAVLGDAAYTYLIFLNRSLNYVRRILNMPYWSLSGYVKVRVKNAIRFVGHYENVVAHHARAQGMDGVVCGHIHQPAIKNIDGVLYHNCGDWIENCSALVEHMDGRIALVKWAEDWPEAALMLADDDDIFNRKPSTPVEVR